MRASSNIPSVASEVPMTIEGNAVVCEFTLGRGQNADFLLHRVDGVNKGERIRDKDLGGITGFV